MFGLQHSCAHVFISVPIGACWSPTTHVCSTPTENLYRHHQPPCSAIAFKIPDQSHVPREDDRVWYTNEFTDRFLYSASSRAVMPVVTAEVSSVPCKAHGCCNMLFSFRPNTTDKAVFDSVCVVLVGTRYVCMHQSIPSSSQIYVQHMFEGVLNRLKNARVEYILVCGCLCCCMPLRIPD